MRMRRVVLGLVIAGPLALLACEGDDPTAKAAAGDAGVTSTEEGGVVVPRDGGCAKGLSACGDTCVDLANDSTQCGACGAPACTTGTTCIEGTCGGEGIKAVSTGATLSCALRVSGSVWCWGGGDAAGLGQRFEAGGVDCRSTTAKCAVSSDVGT